MINLQKGFIGLITIILTSAIALLISSAVLLRSITEATVSSDEEQSNKAWATVNACGESALMALASTSDDGVYVWNNHTNNGHQDVSVGDYSCYYNITGTGTSTPRSIEAESTVSDFVRRISIEVATNTPALDVTSWSEVADF